MVEAVRAPQLTVKCGFCAGFPKVKKRLVDFPPLVFIVLCETLPASGWSAVRTL